MGCQSTIANKITSRDVDYLLAVKGNQKLLYQSIKQCFDDLDLDRGTNITENSSHGRYEKRVCEVLTGQSIIDRLDHKNNWAKLETIVKVIATRSEKGSDSRDPVVSIRYYISSLSNPDPNYIQQAVRAHWGIENSLHWALDMGFNEDQSRIRTDQAPENMSALRQIALNLIKLDKSRDIGVKASIKRAGWDTGYIEKLLGF